MNADEGNGHAGNGNEILLSAVHSAPPPPPPPPLSSRREGNPVGIEVAPSPGYVVVSFDRAISYMTLPPREARRVADAIRKASYQVGTQEKTQGQRKTK